MVSLQSKRGRPRIREACPGCRKWFKPIWRKTLFDGILITTCPLCGEKVTKSVPVPA